MASLLVEGGLGTRLPLLLPVLSQGCFLLQSPAGFSHNTYDQGYGEKVAHHGILVLRRSKDGSVLDIHCSVGFT